MSRHPHASASAPNPSELAKDFGARATERSMDVVFEDSLQLLTVAEACQLLKVSSSWVYAAAKDGRIPSLRVGGPDGPLRFVRADLIAHIEEARALRRPGGRPGAALREVGRRG
jgi:excisionase family DNA binding protein